MPGGKSDGRPQFAFTGDIHAITTANNLVSACIDNHLYQGNELGIDPKRITWKKMS